jgi:hypothetical protein
MTNIPTSKDNMTYLLNLEEFKYHLSPAFATVVNAVFLGTIIVYLTSFFVGGIEKRAKPISNFYFSLVVVTALFSFITSSYYRFLYYKSTEPYFLKSSNVDLTPFYREQMGKSEVHLYVGLSMALFLLIFGALWRLRVKAKVQPEDIGNS